MILDRVVIKNYRSIKDLTIDVGKYDCRIFVGINEAGKSNILNALSLLSLERKATKDDLRIEYDDQEQIEEAYVDFYFKFEENFIKSKIKEYLKSVVTDENINEVLMKKDEENQEVDEKQSITMQQVLANDYIIFTNDLKELKKYWIQLKMDEKFEQYQLKSKYLLPNYDVIGQEIIDINGKTYKVNKYFVIKKELLNADVQKLFSEASIEDMYDNFYDYIIEYINNVEHPKVIYWKYDNEYLLPNVFNINEFMKNTDSCIPLKSMFCLAGVKDITNEIKSKKEGRISTFESFLDRVARASSEYLKEVWNECGDVEFSLRMNAENITISIQDKKNRYSLEQRSDGFKRFITFLLVLAAKVRNGELKDALIIIDEPDIALHISGQKYLLNELIRISQNNNVFFATHSIFMIDRLNIGRHYIVEKNKEVTQIKKVEASNYTEDEVIFNALGYSIFSSLKEKNIIFEGWDDYSVFKLIREKEGYEQLKEFGFVFSHGASKITLIAKMMELANKKYFVISDSDESAKRAKKDFEESHCIGSWYIYDDFVKNIFTLEDFIKHDYIISSIKNVYEEGYDGLAFPEEDFKNCIYKRIQFLETFFRGINKSIYKEKVRLIKKNIYNNFDESYLENSYFELCKEILNK